MEVKCIKCKKLFEIKPQRANTAKYCSRECQKNGTQIPCQQCGSSFYVAKCHTKKRFCSRNCHDEWRSRNKLSFTCTICDSAFVISASLAKDSRHGYERKYCSHECRLKDPALQERLIKMNEDQQKGRVTSIERIGYGMLDAINVPYQKQFTIANKFCVDAFCSNVVIQFDGDYWHANPDKFPQPTARQQRRMKLDASQDAYMTKCGYKTLRLWESDLKKRPDWCFDRIKECIGHTARPDQQVAAP